jgi:hypothetical protein
MKTMYVLLALVFLFLTDQIIFSAGFPEYSIYGSVAFSEEEREEVRQSMKQYRRDMAFVKTAGRKEFLLCMNYEDWERLPPEERVRWRAVTGQVRTPVQGIDRCFHPHKDDFGFSTKPQ